MKTCTSTGAARSLVAAGVVALAVLTACGGPPAGGNYGAPGAIPPGSIPSSVPPQAAAAPVAANAVTIQNFVFGPSSITVKIGTTVTWSNKDGDPHTVTATGGTFHSPTVDIGGTYIYTFTAAGTFDYTCTIHPFMHGTVVVTA